jgi:hypothetical protein
MDASGVVILDRARGIDADFIVLGRPWVVH